jgi:hypothetical protein
MEDYAGCVDHPTKGAEGFAFRFLLQQCDRSIQQLPAEFVDGQIAALGQLQFLAKLLDHSPGDGGHSLDSQRAAQGQSFLGTQQAIDGRNRA